MITQDEITAALKKLGPVSPGVLADHLEVEPKAIGYHLKKMLDAGTLKAAGKSAARRFALPDQEIKDATDAPPQQRKKKSPKGAKKTRKKYAPRAPQAPGPAERFITAVDVERRLVLINGSEPHIFTGEQTLAIATLLFQHYDEA